jgi:ligand-binding sensor domain-containing protein
MKLLAGCLLGTLLASGAAASGAKPAHSYIFRVHNVSDGLSDSEVRSINLAPNGLLVVRTSRSLNIYDGASFRQYYYNHEAVPYNENTGQQQDYFDQSNRMWLTEPDKLWAFDFNTREFVYDVADLLPGQSKGVRLQTLFIDDSLDHWIIDTAGGLHKYSPAKRTLLAVGTEHAPGGEAVIPSQIVRRGQQYWILYRNNVLRCWDEEQGKFLPGEHSLARLPSLAVARRMIAAPDGGLWILYSNALYRYDTRERSVRQVLIRLGGRRSVHGDGHRPAGRPVVGLLEIGVAHHPRRRFRCRATALFGIG